MKVTIIDSAGGSFTLPVNPLTKQVSREKLYTTIDMQDKGEKDIANKGRRIRNVTIEVILPDEAGPYCNYSNIPSPADMMNMIDGWVLSELPIRMIIAADKFNEKVHLIDYTDFMSGQNLGDKTVLLTFRVENSNVDLNYTSIKKKSTPAALKSREEQKAKVKVHTVVRGDSLWKIATKHYGSGRRWREIYSTNKSIIGSNPNLIIPGQKLSIP